MLLVACSARPANPSLLAELLESRLHLTGPEASAHADTVVGLLAKAEAQGVAAVHIENLLDAASALEAGALDVATRLVAAGAEPARAAAWHRASELLSLAELVSHPAMHAWDRSLWADGWTRAISLSRGKGGGQSQECYDALAAALGAGGLKPTRLRSRIRAAAVASGALEAGKPLEEAEAEARTVIAEHIGGRLGKPAVLAEIEKLGKVIEALGAPNPAFRFGLRMPIIQCIHLTEEGVGSSLNDDELRFVGGWQLAGASGSYDADVTIDAGSIAAHVLDVFNPWAGTPTPVDGQPPNPQICDQVPIPIGRSRFYMGLSVYEDDLPDWAAIALGELARLAVSEGARLAIDVGAAGAGVPPGTMRILHHADAVVGSLGLPSAGGAIDRVASQVGRAVRELAGKDMFNMLTAEVRFSNSGTVAWTPCVLRRPMLGISGPGTATWQRGDGRPSVREVRGRGEYFPVLDFRVR